MNRMAFAITPIQSVACKVQADIANSKQPDIQGFDQATSIHMRDVDNGIVIFSRVDPNFAKTFTYAAGASSDMIRS